jgi:predicted membrane-bound spermidine synthase
MDECVKQVVAVPVWLVGDLGRKSSALGAARFVTRNQKTCSKTISETGFSFLRFSFPKTDPVRREDERGRGEYYVARNSERPAIRTFDKRLGSGNGVLRLESAVYHGRVVSLALPIAFLLGAAALGGQVCWFRISTVAVGGTIASAAITLSSAMAGLAAGAYVGGTLTGHRIPRRVWVLTIACGAFALLAIPQILQFISGIEGSLTVRRVLTGLLLCAGHLPFGAVMPVITIGDLPGRNQTAKRGGRLYAANALGSAAGALLVAELLAPRMGLDTISMALGGIFLIGLIHSFKTTPVTQRPAAEPKDSPMAATLLVTVCALGLLGLAAELLWFRTLGFFWRGGTQAYALVVSGYVLGLALGSAVASYVSGGRQVGRAGIVWCGCLAAVALMAGADQSGRAIATLPGAERMLTAAVFVGLPAAFSGASFVFLLGLAGSRQNIGVLYALNSVGASISPLLVWFLLPLLSWPTWTLASVGVGYGLMALGMALGQRRSFWVPLVAAIVATPLAVSVLRESPFTAIYTNRPPTAPPPDFGTTFVVYSRVDVDSVVAVTRESQMGYEMLWMDRNGQADSGLWSMRVKKDLGRLPATLANSPARKALLIGLGSGVTASALMDSPVQSLDVAELSEGAIEAAQTVMSDLNGHLFDRPNLVIHHADGRSILTDATEPYDLVVTDITYPSVPGAGTLYSREFYALARRRLTSDGLFVHWVPCFQMSPLDVSAVVAAFLESFPEGSAWIHFLRPTGLILGLVGSRQPQRLPAANVPYFALGPGELRTLAGAAPPIRDADPRLEYRRPSPSEFAYEGQVIEQVLGVMRSTRPDERFIAPADREQWMRNHKAWVLFSEGGLAEFRARAARDASSQQREAGRLAELYQEAEQMAPEIVPAEHILSMKNLQSHLDNASRASKNDPMAQERFLRDAAADPTVGEGNIKLAGLLERQGRLDEAILEVQRAIAKHPYAADGHMRLAMLSFKHRKYAESRQAFARACELRPDRPALYRVLEEELRRVGY